MESQDFKIAILMSTYNAARYLAEQIDSILSQQYHSWTLYVRDDGSTDKTHQIIRDYVGRDSRIVFLNENQIVNFGVTKSFLTLLNSVKADFYMFCDQDDVWLPNKVSDTLAAMLEQQYDQIPILVHCDLQVVDSNLQQIDGSFFHRQGLPKQTSLQNLLIQNNVTGCTVMVNNKLKDLAYKTSDKVIIHDWWLALIAECFGKIVFVDRALIKYRQHSGNVIGSNTIVKKMFTGYVKQIHQALIAVMKQNAVFLTCFSGELTHDQEQAFKVGSTFLMQGAIERLSNVRRVGLFKVGKTRNFIFYCLLIVLPRVRGVNYD